MTRLNPNISSHRASAMYSVFDVARLHSSICVGTDCLTEVWHDPLSSSWKSTKKVFISSPLVAWSMRQFYLQWSTFFCIESSQFIYLFYETDCLWSKNLIIWSNRKFVNSFKNLFYLWIQNGIDLMEKITFIQMVSWPCPEFQRLFHSNINPGICYERRTASICQDFFMKKKSNLKWIKASKRTSH